MKYGFLGAAITAVALPCLVLLAFAQGKQNFTLVNQTGYDISEVYVSPANSSDWEEDVLGEDILKIAMMSKSPSSAIPSSVSGT